jgi:hypothetical protein
MFYHQNLALVKYTKILNWLIFKGGVQTRSRWRKKQRLSRSAYLTGVKVGGARIQGQLDHFLLYYFTYLFICIHFKLWDLHPSHKYVFCNRTRTHNFCVLQLEYDRTWTHKICVPEYVRTWTHKLCVLEYDRTRTHKLCVPEYVRTWTHKLCVLEYDRTRTHKLCVPNSLTPASGGWILNHQEGVAYTGYYTCFEPPRAYISLQLSLQLTIPGIGVATNQPRFIWDQHP